ncbi:hypothetical protein HHI36_005051 [Cryptolaemus montrouzieri]|uniref:Phorbol-ester/DAG-type domain-containing protein n=1 Tax=Cryptolaemus montrouzieri TaxID=559131 RepID=A0ABD2NT10_9CUCU
MTSSGKVGTSDALFTEPNKCDFCGNSVVKSGVKCNVCPKVFHRSCSGKIKKCCDEEIKLSSETTSLRTPEVEDSGVKLREINKESTYVDLLLKIIFEFESKNAILEKNNNLLEFKIATLESSMQKNLSAAKGKQEEPGRKTVTNDLAIDANLTTANSNYSLSLPIERTATQGSSILTSEMAPAPVKNITNVPKTSNRNHRCGQGIFAHYTGFTGSMLPLKRLTIGNCKKTWVSDVVKRASMDLKNLYWLKWPFFEQHLLFMGGRHPANPSCGRRMGHHFQENQEKREQGNSRRHQDGVLQENSGGPGPGHLGPKVLDTYEVPEKCSRLVQ